ncbi:winged helix-turn-helix transcriptional regulator [Pyrolobus fumarii]|uniref:winged helix-turn-helix transcriptional regulator n=1 Tax=Pyrolobus fumarii TaxID=54252 RepID=UPI000650012C|nr:winged helix-turn-helix transcriptional regulator [Pyrolobus fumarii]
MASTLDELDIKILKALAEAGTALRPKEIAERIGEDGRRVAAKMRKLVRLGYVERLEDGRYQITDAGKQAVEQHATA